MSRTRWPAWGSAANTSASLTGMTLSARTLKSPADQVACCRCVIVPKSTVFAMAERYMRAPSLYSAGGARSAACRLWLHDGDRGIRPGARDAFGDDRVVDLGERRA